MGALLFSDDPNAFWSFLIFTVILGGAGAWAAGSAFASTWRPPTTLIPALLVLAMAIRFLHYAIAGEDILSLHYYLVSLVVVAAFGAFGFMSQRADQMARQYSWLFKKSGPVNWAPK